MKGKKMREIGNRGKKEMKGKEMRGDERRAAGWGRESTSERNER